MLLRRPGQKKILYRQSGKKGQVTVVACASAVGQAIPPMIIFDAQNLNHAWTKDEVPGTRYDLSDTGWINADLFKGWMVEHFIQCAVPGRPCCYCLMDIVLITSQMLFGLQEHTILLCYVCLHIQLMNHSR